MIFSIFLLIYRIYGQTIIGIQPRETSQSEITIRLEGNFEENVEVFFIKDNDRILCENVRKNLTGTICDLQIPTGNEWFDKKS